MVIGFQKPDAIKLAICTCRKCRFDPWTRKMPWRRKWQPTPVLLPGKFHGQRGLADYSCGAARVRHD